MLGRALRTLAERPSPALLGAFCWKLLALEGLGPRVDSCTSCEGPGPLVAFYAEVGGFLCRACRRGQAVSPGAFELVRLTLSGGLSRALGAGVEDPSSAAEIAHLGLAALEHHLDRRLRTVRHLFEPGLRGA